MRIDATSTRILLVNHWNDDNRGDSAITLQTISLIRHRYPDSEIRVMCLYPRNREGLDDAVRHIRAAHPDIEFRPSFVPLDFGFDTKTRSRRVNLGLWIACVLLRCISTLIPRLSRSLYEDLHWADIVFLDGGSNLYDDPQVLRSVSWARLAALVVPGLCAQRRKTPVVAVGHTIGPFSRQPVVWLMRRFLDRLAFLEVRDDASFELVRSWGCRAVRGPDAAFGIVPRRSVRVHQTLNESVPPGGRRMCVSVRQHYTSGRAADERVVRECAQALSDLFDRNVITGVTIVPHTTGPTPIEDDRPISRELGAALAGRCPVDVVGVDFAPDELAAFYGAFDCMVSMRLHGAILAMVGGTPALAIQYFSTKTPGAMRSAGLPDSWIDYSDVSADLLTKHIETLLGRGSAEERELGTTIDDLRRELQEMTSGWPDPNRRRVSSVAARPQG